MRNLIGLIRELLRRFSGGKSGPILIILNIANLVLGLAVALILANILSEEDYGSYVWALALVTILAMPIEFGLPNLLTREIASYRALERDRKITALLAFAAIGIFATFLVIAIGFFAAYSAGMFTTIVTPALQLAAFGLLLPLALMHAASGIMRGYQEPVRSVLPDSIFKPCLLLGLVGLLYWQGEVSPESVMLGHFCAVVIAFLWAGWQTFKLARKMDLPFDFVRGDMEIGPWIKSLIPIAMVRGVRILNRRFDTILLGALATTIAVAEYNLAMQFAGLILLGQTAINTIIGPRVSAAFARNEQGSIQRMVAFSTLASAAFAGLAVIGLLLVGDTAIGILFDGRYSNIFAFLAVLCIGQFFSAAMGPTALLLTMTRHEGLTLKTGLVALVVNVGLNLILIPKLGGIGAAIASSATLLAIQSQRWWLVRKTLGIRSDLLAAFSYTAQFARAQQAKQSSESDPHP